MPSIFFSYNRQSWLSRKFRSNFKSNQKLILAEKTWFLYWKFTIFPIFNECLTTILVKLLNILKIKIEKRSFLCLKCKIISYNQYTGPISTSSSVDRSGIVFYSLDGQLCDYQSSSYIPGKMHGRVRRLGKSKQGDVWCRSKIVTFYLQVIFFLTLMVSIILL